MTEGLARILTAIAGFRVQSASRYTTRPIVVFVFLLYSFSFFVFASYLFVPESLDDILGTQLSG